jgi:hypothetical protein
LLKSLLPLVTLCFVVVSSCTAPSRHHSLQSNAQAPAAWPKTLAVYMPWFGDHEHRDVGYSSNDPAVLHSQIQQARVKGISAFVVDWYGGTVPFSDHNFALLEQAANEDHFQVALLYNEPADDDDQATDDAITAFDKAYKTYIGPEAPNRGAYLTYHDHPVIFIFPKRGHVDWNRVMERCSAWESSPLLFYKDEPPAQYAADFAGLYPWVQPGRQGWTPDGSNWGQQYLENFYKNVKTKYPDKIAVGAAWPGFNDSAAKWGLNRHMQARCGKTLEETTRMYGRYYDDSNPLPFMLIETWNDYEEGTAIERLNFADCQGGA